MYIRLSQCGFKFSITGFQISSPCQRIRLLLLLLLLVVVVVVVVVAVVVVESSSY
jgi:hypothetical protein